MPAAIPKELWDEMVDAYLAGKSLTEAAATHGCRHNSLLYHLKKRGIASRGVKGQRYRAVIDETRFSEVADEETAYWLGFLFADGYITRNTKGHMKLGLLLAEADAGHVRKFARFLRCQKEPAIERNRGKDGGHSSCRLVVSSPPVVERLIGLGLGYRKTWTVNPWAGPPHLLPHFWRGCIDGDGSLYFVRGRRPGTRTAAVHFVGTETMVRGLWEFVRSRLGRETGSIFSKPGIGEVARENGHHSYFVLWGGNPLCKEVASLFYKDATVSLGRKQVIAEEMMNYELVRRPKCNLDRKGVQSLIDKYGTLARAASALGVPKCTLYTRAKKLGFVF